MSGDPRRARSSCVRGWKVCVWTRGCTRFAGCEKVAVGGDPAARRSIYPTSTPSAWRGVMTTGEDGVPVEETQDSGIQQVPLVFGVQETPGVGEAREQLLQAIAREAQH